MSSNIQKFQLSQGGKTYILTTQVENESIKITCVESQVPNSIIYLGLFSLTYLRQLNKMFNTMTTIYQALEFLNTSIESQKVSVQYEGNLINIILYFNRETETEEIIKTDYNTKAVNYNTQPIIYNTVEEQNQYMQIPVTTTTQTTENVENTVNYTIPETTNYTTENNYIENQTYQTYDYNNTNDYQTYENVNTNYDLNLNNEVQVQQTQTQTQENTTYTTKVTTPQVETLTIPLTYTPPQVPQVDNSQYLAEIEQLKNQIKILREENTLLRQKTVIQTKDQSGEIMLLKQEIERLKRQLEQYMNLQNSFENYKRIKEEEIRLLKLKIEELLNTNKKLQELLLAANNQIEELKLQLNKVIMEKNYSESIIKQQKITGGGKQTLTIHDTHMEIIKGEILRSPAELELLTRKICQNYNKITINLLYKATIDSDQASVFHNRCDAAKNTLVLIKSGNGKRFGGYTSCNWGGNSIEKRDENAFVFSLDKMKIYPIISGELAIGCYPKYGPVFLGCQIRIYDEFFKKGGTTFEKGLNYETEEDYELTGGLKEFAVKEIEVYGVELK